MCHAFSDTVLQYFATSGCVLTCTLTLLLWHISAACSGWRVFSCPYFGCTIPAVGINTLQQEASACFAGAADGKGQRPERRRERRDRLRPHAKQSAADAADSDNASPVRPTRQQQQQQPPSRTQSHTNASEQPGGAAGSHAQPRDRSKRTRGGRKTHAPGEPADPSLRQEAVEAAESALTNHSPPLSLSQNQPAAESAPPPASDKLVRRDRDRREPGDQRRPASDSGPADDAVNAPPGLQKGPQVSSVADFYVKGGSGQRQHRERRHRSPR